MSIPTNPALVPLAFATTATPIFFSGKKAMYAAVPTYPPPCSRSRSPRNVPENQPRPCPSRIRPVGEEAGPETEAPAPEAADEETEEEEVDEEDEELEDTEEEDV